MVVHEHSNRESANGMLKCRAHVATLAEMILALAANEGHLA